MKKDNNKEILLFLVGLLIISWVFWNRFIRIRLPKTFDDFNYVLIIISIISTVIGITLIIWKIWREYRPKKTSGKIVNYLLNFRIVTFLLDKLVIVKESVDQGPKLVYENLIYKRYNVAHILEIPFAKISWFLRRRLSRRENELIELVGIFTGIHIIFNTLPRFIPPIIFVTEILLINELNHFYQSLLLYTIPLFYNCLRWILRQLADTNIWYTTGHIKFKSGIVSFQDRIPIVEDAVDIIARKNDLPLLIWFYESYTTYVVIKWFVYRLDVIADKFKDSESLFVLIMYLIGWLYIFIKIS